MISKFSMWWQKSRFHSWWQKIRQHPFIAIGILVLLIALIILFIAVVLSNGTGFSGYTVKSTATETTLSPPRTTKVTTTVQSQPGKTLWDLLQLLAALAIPVVVGFGAAWFTAQQGKVSERENKDNQREKALQDYIDKMSELLLENKLRDSAKDDEVRTIARVRTLTVLRGLDSIRKASVIQFLQESGLIDKDKCIIRLSSANFRGAHLSEAFLLGADLSKADLSGAHLRGAQLLEADLSLAHLSLADLSKADLREAHLSKADLGLADLREAHLSSANLFGAHLFGAHLSEAFLLGADLSKADLSKADLSLADLSKADLSEANLSQADLSKADLRGAKVTEEQLEQARSLKGATMPDGLIHP